MPGESFDEQLARVRMMTDEDQETWDLSPNDVAALKAVLHERDILDRTLDAIDKSESRDMPIEWFNGRDELKRLRHG